MKEFLEYIVKSIIPNPDSVIVEETQDGSVYNYLITVHPDDMGIIIGKEGRTIKSIRSIAKGKAIKDGVRINVELYEPDRPAKGAPKDMDKDMEEDTDMDMDMEEDEDLD